MNDGIVYWEQDTVYWPRPYITGPPGGDSNLWMMSEDAGLELWSHVNQNRNAALPRSEIFNLGECSDELAEIITSGFPGYSSMHNIDDTIAEMLRIIAREIVLRGEITYEIRRRKTISNGSGVLDQIRMSYVPTESIIRIANKVYQRVPQGVLDEYPDGAMLQIDPEWLLYFDAPKRWKRALRNVRLLLPEIRESQDAWMMRSATGTGSEDINTVLRAYKVETARQLMPLGWNGRGLFQEHITDYHHMLRELRWKEFCIELRDHILTIIGSMIMLVGKLQNESPRLEWRNMPSLKDVEDARKRLNEGCKLNELLKPFRGY